MIDIEQIIARVKAIKGFGSDKELAAFLSLSATDFSNRKKRETLLPLLIQCAIKEDLNIDMLIRGRDGDIRKAPAQQIGGNKRWDVYDLRLSREPGDWDRYQSVAVLDPDRYCHGMTLLKMSDSSMSPTIIEDAVIGVKIIYNEPAFETRYINGDIHLLWLVGEGPIVRRVFKDIGKLILRAEDRKFPDIIISKESVEKEEIRLLGYVKWVLQYL